MAAPAVAGEDPVADQGVGAGDRVQAGGERVVERAEGVVLAPVVGDGDGDARGSVLVEDVADQDVGGGAGDEGVVERDEGVVVAIVAQVDVDVARAAFVVDVADQQVGDAVAGGQPVVEGVERVVVADLVGDVDLDHLVDIVGQVAVVEGVADRGVVGFSVG